jgi:hypothetical protein
MAYDGGNLSLSSEPDEKRKIKEHVLVPPCQKRRLVFLEIIQEGALILDTTGHVIDFYNRPGDTVGRKRKGRVK